MNVSYRTAKTQPYRTKKRIEYPTRIVGNQNNSYLLLVNGKNMNMKCSNGPIFEIQNKDLNDITDALNEHGYTKLSFTSNASLNWKLPIRKFDLQLNLYAMNLISHNHIRYVIQFWEPGNNRQYPRQCGFVEGPISVGLKLTARF